jgi:membrane-associated phospholipid phosphatase
MPETPVIAPPRSRALVRRLDGQAERVFDRLRGRKLADRTLYELSELGDFSLIWLLVGTARGLISERRQREALRLFVTLGLESLVVNQGVKRLFNRKRPVFEGLRPHRLRRPSTSSFPSGHASAAACAVVLLADDDPLWPAYVALGVAVAASRVHVRIHHASDVVAGIPLGLAIGSLARRYWPVEESSSQPRG